MSGGKLDIMKAFKASYRAGRKPALVEVAAGQYLAIEGRGVPGGENFVAAVGALYAMAYTMKMGRKADGLGDYTIGKLEGIYWAEDGADLATAPKEDWRWQLLIRTPDVVDGNTITEKDLATALGRLRDRKKDQGADRVKIVKLDGGRCVQMRHVGPYENEHETLAIMLEFCEAEGLKPRGRHHEVYISDPRRVSPEKLKTVLRMQVA